MPWYEEGTAVQSSCVVCKQQPRKNSIILDIIIVLLWIWLIFIIVGCFFRAQPKKEVVIENIPPVPQQQWYMGYNNMLQSTCQERCRLVCD